MLQCTGLHFSTCNNVNGEVRNCNGKGVRVHEHNTPGLHLALEGFARPTPQIKKTQDELQWIVAQGLLSALTIPGFS